MKKNHVIEFEQKERILEKAKKYIESLELFSGESDQAIPLLLRAMKLADGDLKREIMLLLGTLAKKESIWPLYQIMTDASESEEVRHHAAIQISVMGPLLRNPQPLIDRLLQDTGSSNAELRFHVAFALGWEGNFQAAIPLIERLYDTDDRVRQTAVNALCNLRDDRILPLLLERLEHGAAEQKRSILLNLWRFDSKLKEVTEVYLKCLESEEPDVRFDALACLGLLIDVRAYLEVYRKCLKDPDNRIRGLAIRRLSEDAGDAVLQSFPAEIEALLEDPDMEVKRASLKILGKRRV